MYEMSAHALAILNRPSADTDPHIPGAPDHRLSDPADPQLAVLDLGATRGDGIFETISVGNGRPQSLDHHLRRFAASARMLDLPAPDRKAWAAAVFAVIAAMDESPEAWVKTVMTRGIEGDGRPTGWVYGTHSLDFSHQREHGIRAVTLDRGFRHDVERTSPWLLAGAKTLSYAVNRAVLREAARRGADNVIFVSSDGFVLEGPTSSVLLRRGDRLISPGTRLGILDGTTLASIFRFAESAGMHTGFELFPPAELFDADAVWLVSSVRHAAPVRQLDGRPLSLDSDLTATMNAVLGSLEE